MRKFTSFLIVLAMILALCVPVMADAGEKSPDTVILYTNDVHSFIDRDISYDLVAGLKNRLEQEYAHVLLVDAGDHVQGSAYGSMDKGRSVIELMNAAGYDAATLGNHEFDYNMSGCMDVISWAEYPYLSCNFFHEEGGVRGENVLEAYTLFECGEQTVAIVGITTPETMSKSTPAYFQDAEGNLIYGISGGADGEALYSNVQDSIDEAREAGATTVIALGHLGVEVGSSPWTSRETIANVTGLDAFIDGHSHTLIEEEEVADEAGEPVILTQTGEYFNNVGMMIIDSETGAITTELLSAEVLDGEIPDSAVKTLKEAWIHQVDEELGQVIGTVNVVLDNYDEEGNRLVRSRSTNSGDFSADALYYLFDNMGLDVDVAVMNGGGIRNTAVTGEITYKTCKEIHTFGNVACLQTVTGQQLLDALEWGARNLGIGEDGSLLHPSGLTYDVDTSIVSTVQFDDTGVWTGPPTGEYRVHNVEIYDKGTDTWEPLDLRAEYNLAGYNYTLRDLGGGFAMFDGAVNVLDYVMEDYMVLAGYVQGFEDAVVEAYNSPLTAKYPGFYVDYSDVYGSGRMDVGVEKIRPQLYVGGVNAYETPTGAGWSFDAVTNTLTLSGAHIDKGYAYVDEPDAKYYAGIWAVGDLNMVLEEGTENSVVLSEGDGHVSAGIQVDGDLTVTGEGALSVDSGSALVESTGVEVWGILTVNGCVLDATAGRAAGDSYSIGIMVDDLKAVDANITAASGFGGTSIGLYAYGDVRMENSFLTVSAGGSYGGVGVLIEENAIIQNSVLIADVVDTVESCEGVSVYGAFTAENSTLHITTEAAAGTDTGEEPYGTGIYAGSLILDRCDVVLDAGKDGIVADEVTVIDGSVDIRAGGNGICSMWGGLTVECTQVTRGEISPMPYGTTLSIEAGGDYGIYLAAGLTISPKLTISAPEDGAAGEFEDLDGFAYYGIVDEAGNPAKSIKIEPLVYAVYVEGMSNQMVVRVPAGETPNEFYRGWAGKENLDQVLIRPREGYEMVGWYTDQACTEGMEFCFDDPLTGDVTIYPKWVKVGCSGEEDNCPSLNFRDLDITLWYHKATDHVITKGLMQGVGNGKFAPERLLDRASFVTILWRMAGSPEMAYEARFSDVEEDAWYADAVCWAAAHGIVQGVSGSRFAPNMEISREQMALILLRYAVCEGLDTASGAEELPFLDADQISDWALEAVEWAYGNGIINGKGGNVLDPLGTSTRAEVAQVLMNMEAVFDR